MTRSLILCALLAASACAVQGVDQPTEEAVEPQALVAPGRSCAVIRCRPGYTCKETCNGAQCVPLQGPTDPECKVDADCRLFSDYCDGCNCVALGVNEPAPICTGDVVQCLVDPCRELEARCEYGSCVVSSGAATQ